MKKVSGYMEISAIVYCPYCNEMVDLFQLDDFRGESYIFDKLCSNKGWGIKNWDEEISCPACSKKFKIKDIEW